MNYSLLSKWMGLKILVEKRLKEVMIVYILFLMISFRKHSLDAAARFSNSTKSRFSRFLMNHPDLAVIELDQLSKRQARQFSQSLRYLADDKLPWKIAILIDATLQGRSSMHAENVKRFNHGKGFVIGHQWTNIVLFFNGILIPLAPIAFYSRKYCRQNRIEYMTEHESVIEYIENLDLYDYIGHHDPKEVVVMGDSGYDNRNIEKAIASKEWIYLIALKKKRSVKTEKEYAETTKSKDWSQVQKLFKRHRWIKWVSVFLPKNSPEKKRMEFRIRQTVGYLRYVGKAQLICSEFKKRPKGRKKYLASNDLKAEPWQILLAYRIRWEIEIFHKMIKMHLGFEDVATKSFDSVISHVHLVYCAYILLNFQIPGIPKRVKSIADKQRIIKMAIKKKELSHMLQVLSQINGTEKLKSEIREALECCYAS